MQKRLAERPTELRQAYMRIILNSVTVDHHEVRLDKRSERVLRQAGEYRQRPSAR